MSHTVVKILFDDDGEKRDEPVWCLSEFVDGAPRTLCSGEVYGDGESSVIYKEKTVERGGITCDNCKSIINRIKSIKL